MALFWTCPDCGSNLDPGERCDCRKRDAISEHRPGFKSCSQLHSAGSHFDKRKAHCPPAQR